MKKLGSKEVKIAIATITGGLLLFFGVNYLKGINILKPANYYYTIFPDVTGLAVSTPIVLDGFKIGLVNDIEYDFNRPGNIIVELSVDPKLKIPEGSYTTMETSLLGEATVILHLNKTETKMLQLGDTIRGRKTTGMMDNISGNVLPKLEDMLPRIDSILYSLQVILANQSINHSLAQIDQTTKNLETASRQLAVVINKDVPAITSNLSNASSDFAQISANLKGVDFQGTMNSMNQSVKNFASFTDNLNNPNSSLGLLMNNRTLYDNLAKTAENADSLMIDLKKNPKRYVHFSVFGKKENIKPENNDKP